MSNFVDEMFGEDEEYSSYFDEKEEKDDPFINDLVENQYIFKNNDPKKVECVISPIVIKKKKQKKIKKKRKNKPNISVQKMKTIENHGNKKKNISYIEKPKVNVQKDSREPVIPSEVNFSNQVKHLEKISFEKICSTSDDIDLVRRNSAVVMSGNKIFIHGGYTFQKKKTYVSDDLICYNSLNDEYTEYSQYFDDDNCTKLLRDHIGVEIIPKNFLFFSGSGFCWVLKLNNSDNPKELFKNSHWRCITLENFHVKRDGIIKDVKNFSYANDRNILYIFGGEFSSGVVTNQFIKIVPYTKQKNKWSNSYYIKYSGVQIIDNLLSTTSIDGIKRNLIHAHYDDHVNFDYPCARKGHSSCLHRGMVYIYGGINSNGEILNCLWRYPTRNWGARSSGGAYRWERVIVGTPPPCLYDAVIFSNNTDLILHGGKYQKNCIYNNNEEDPEVEKYIYKYKSHDEKWIACKSSTSNSLHRSGHVVVKNSNLFCYIVQGVNEKDTYENCIVKVNRTQDTEIDIDIIKHIEKMYRKKRYCDSKVYVKYKEEEMKEIDIHKCIVACRSVELRKILMENDNITIHGYEFNVVKAFIQFLYTGNIVLKKNVDQFLSITKKYGSEHYETIRCLFIPKLYSLRVFHEIVERLKLDFQNLLKNAEKKEYFPDLMIVCERDGAIIPCHKVILVRSVFVTACLSSGMKEEIENKLFFKQLSKNGLDQVMNYLYTDEIENIDNSTCIEVHIFSILFKLSKVASHCRKIILGLIVKENAFSVLNLFDLYQDKVIVNRCIKVIVQEYNLSNKEMKELDQFVSIQSDEMKNEILHANSVQSMRAEKKRKKEKMRKLGKLKRDKLI